LCLLVVTAGASPGADLTETWSAGPASRFLAAVSGNNEQTQTPRKNSFGSFLITSTSG
jgi:hypothetical protein